MTPYMAAASVFNPVNVAQGIANEYQANYNYSGSHYDAANLTFNPITKLGVNSYQAATGNGIKYNNYGTSLSTGQRIGSGIAAGFNAVEAVGIGYGAAKLTTSIAPSLNRISISSSRTILREGDYINRVWDSRWTKGSIYSGPRGGSYSPGGALPINATTAIETRGLKDISGVINNAERGGVFRVNRRIPAILQKSIGGSEPEIFIPEKYRQYLELINESISTIPKGR